jgi:hypothetical protein
MSDDAQQLRPDSYRNALGLARKLRLKFPIDK